MFRWKHSDDWFVALYEMEDKIDSGERLIEISITSDKFKYVSGHVVDGRNLFPATGYLCLVWETFSMMTGQLYTEVSVVIENVKLNRATTIPKEGTIEMTVVIQKGNYLPQLVSIYCIKEFNICRSKNKQAVVISKWSKGMLLLLLERFVLQRT